MKPVFNLPIAQRERRNDLVVKIGLAMALFTLGALTTLIIQNYAIN